MNELLESFTAHLKAVLTRALCLAVEDGGETITPTHLLWALGTEHGSIGAEILRKAGATEYGLQMMAHMKEIDVSEESVARASKVAPILSEESKNVIEKAMLAAGKHGHRYVGTEHLLHGIVEAKTQAIDDFFAIEPINEDFIKENLKMVFKTTANFPDSKKSSNNKIKENEKLGEEKQSALAFFTTELTSKEVAKTIDPIIGRDEEIDRVVAILSRRTKNNPLLIGEPGVGKTAIAEGLAKRIIAGKVPDSVARMHLHRLDMTALVAGTMYRGDFELRMMELLEELNHRDDVILFIDEIHTIIGAGSASGTLDVANILKPALARGELRLIGATTQQEYKKHIVTEAALERRFAVVTVREPSEKETRTVLTGIAKHYEKHHGVTYRSEALDAIVQIAARAMPTKQFPDKAIDLLDEVGAFANVSRTPIDKDAVILRGLDEELDQVLFDKRKAITSEKYPDAVKLKDREVAILKQIEAIEKVELFYPIVNITVDMVKTVASRMTGIPLSRLTVDDHNSLRSLADRLKARVIAQDDAVEQVASAMRRAKLGFADPTKPLASFLFAGPSGVGKTALAKALSIEMFGDVKSLIRFDMSEFSEGFSISKLIGAPAGYVGYREAAKLTDAVKERPHCILLFDELEKAHKDVQALLLQILDEGFITDAAGTKVHFHNTIIIMTTNVGRDRFEKTSLGFSIESDRSIKLQAELRAVLEENFRPELVNRIGHTCLFKPLDRLDIVAITRIGLDDLLKRLKSAKLSVTLPKKLAEVLAREVKPIHGARDVHRVIQEKLEHAIADAVLATKKPKMKLSVTLDTKGTIQIR